jgi:hypothetical protein
MDNDTIQQSYTYQNPEVNQAGWTYPHFGYGKVGNKNISVNFATIKADLSGL